MSNERDLAAECSELLLKWGKSHSEHYLAGLLTGLLEDVAFLHGGTQLVESKIRMLNDLIEGQKKK